MLVRLLSGADADAQRAIPWRRPYGPLPVDPADVAQAVADLIDTATDTARHGAELLAEVAPGDWRPGRAHLASACRPRVDPAAPRPAGPDLRNAEIGYSATFWEAAGADPAASAAAVMGQFASGELFAVGGGFAAYDFTVQRNLSIAALAQISVPGGIAPDPPPPPAPPAR